MSSGHTYISDLIIVGTVLLVSCCALIKGLVLLEMFNIGQIYLTLPNLNEPGKLRLVWLSDTGLPSLSTIVWENLLFFS